MESVLKLKYRYWALIILFIVAGVFLFTQVINTEKSNGATRQIPVVSTINVNDYRNIKPLLKTVGVVESTSQAELRSQVSAPVEKVHVQIGDSVYAGQVLVELSNADLFAQLKQAEAGVNIQKSKLDELLSGARSEEIQIQETKVANTNISLENAKTSLIDTLQDGYTKSDDAVRNRVDQFFSNARSSNPQLIFLTANGQLETDIEWGRLIIEGVLSSWSQSLDKLTAQSDIFIYIDESEQNLSKVKSLLDDVSLAVNNLTVNSDLSQATIDAWKADVVTARTNINTAISNLSTSKEKLKTAESNLALAENELILKNAGSTQEQLTAQESQVEQAEANALNVRVQLAKTIIRSPINGAVVTISPRVGEFISSGQTIAHIVNDGGLQVKAYVNSTDAKKIQVGADVVVEGNISAVVSRVAPGIDPSTQKVEVLIALVSVTDKSITAGQYINVSIHQESESTGTLYFLPLQSVKVASNGTYVYTVNDDNKIEERIVTVGSVLDDRIEIYDGVTPNMDILASVRGLKPGQEVAIQQF